MNDSKRIKDLLGDEINTEIQNMLKISKSLAVQTGGLKSAENNIPLRDEKGHFIGSKKR